MHLEALQAKGLPPSQAKQLPEADNEVIEEKSDVVAELKSAGPVDGTMTSYSGQEDEE